MQAVLIRERLNAKTFHPQPTTELSDERNWIATRRDFCGQEGDIYAFGVLAVAREVKHGA
jgi:hypothetical protein